MSKIAIFSDIHLGVHQNSDFWLNLSEQWIDWFLADKNSRGISEMIFLGDWFHYRDEISVKTLHKSADITRRFKLGQTVTMIPGNHDCYFKDNADTHSLSIFKGSENIIVYDKITTRKYGDKTFTFCPWGTKIFEIPDSDVILGHFELTNFRFNAHHICEKGDDPEALLTKAKLIFSGHFHSRDEKKFGNKGSIVMVGNPFEMDFGDAYQKKGYYILDTDTLEYEFIENSLTPKHIVVYLSKLITLKSIDVFSEFIPNNIIKLVVDKNISTEHLDILLGKMNSYSPIELRVDHDVNYNKIRVNDEEVYDLTSVSLETAIEEFVNMLDIQNKKEVIEYTIELMQKSA
jgi:DNA repair exonuclease SbcCD nuclease subunit